MFQRIEDRRTQLGLTQDALCGHCAKAAMSLTPSRGYWGVATWGYQLGYLSNEAGDYLLWVQLEKQLPVDTRLLQALSIALSCTADYLLFGTEEYTIQVADAPNRYSEKAIASAHLVVESLSKERNYPGASDRSQDTLERLVLVELATRVCEDLKINFKPQLTAKGGTPLRKTLQSETVRKLLHYLLLRKSNEAGTQVAELSFLGAAMFDLGLSDDQGDATAYTQPNIPKVVVTLKEEPTALDEPPQGELLKAVQKLRTKLKLHDHDFGEVFSDILQHLFRKGLEVTGPEAWRLSQQVLSRYVNRLASLVPINALSTRMIDQGYNLYLFPYNGTHEYKAIVVPVGMPALMGREVTATSLGAVMDSVLAVLPKRYDAREDRREAAEGPRE